jgi:RTX calcium-binding nonapeptide repeat (4 copies)
MTDAVAASPGANRYSRIYYSATGKIIEERIGGTVAWRNNNPGNIMAGSFANAHGAIGSDGIRAIFPTKEVGLLALRSLLNTQSYQSRTLDDAVRYYAPPSENDTASYQAMARTALGLPGNTPFKDLTPEQFEKFIGVILKKEGYTVGTSIIRGDLSLDDAINPTSDGNVLYAISYPNSISSGVELISQSGPDSEGLYLFTYRDSSGKIVLVRVNPDATNESAVKPDAEAIRYVAGEALGHIVGSTIGGIVGGLNPLNNLAARSVFSVIGARLGAAVQGAIQNNDFSTFIDVAFKDGVNGIVSNLGTNLASSSIGTISSLLTIDFTDALGVDGSGAVVFGSLVGSALQQVVSNIGIGAAPLTGFSGLDKVFATAGDNALVIDGVSVSGPGTLAVNSIATFLGNRLGSLVVSPQTQAGVILSNLGSAVGAYAFSTAGLGLGSSLLSGVFGTGFLATQFVFPGIGAFVGFVLGGLIGSLFGKKRPKPSASADTVLNFSSGYYELGTVTVNGGNRALVESMALQARDTLNGLIQVVSGQIDKAPVINTSSPTQQYGHTNTQIWAKFNGGAQQNFADAAAAVEWGTMQAIRQTQIAGGDILAKRVLAYSPSTTLTALAGDLQIAADYALYLKNRALINAEILTPWNSLSAADKSFFTANQATMTRILAKNEVALSSADLSFYNNNKPTADRIIAALTTSEFAAGWIITLQRAAELQLDEWKPSDFYGGFKSLIDSFKLTEQGVGYEQLSFSWSWMLLGVALPGTAPQGIFALATSASADGRAFNIAGFGPAVGYSYSSWDAAQGRWSTSNSHDFVMATDANPLLYDDLYNGISGGNDLFFAGSNNDTLRGREGSDWLAGNAGNDLIEGGLGNDVLLGGTGDDKLFGNEGDDYLAGGEGNDHTGVGAGLYGGAGNDTLVQNITRSDTFGEDGDDLFIMTEDNAAMDLVDGGLGIDTISYERFTAAVTINLATPHALGGVWRNILGDQVGNVENVTGSRQNDTITGDTAANLLRGLDGNDNLNGADGNDTLEGGLGNDTLNGGNGIDTLSYARSQSPVSVSLGGGVPVGGDAVGDSWTGIENLSGAAFDDMLGGDAGANRISGLRGNDWLLVSAGADTLDGGDGFDTVDYSSHAGPISASLATGGVNSAGHSLVSIEHIVGSAFADTLSGTNADEGFTGGGGNDVLAGGGGADRYFIGKNGGLDTVTDDNIGDNVLVLNDATWSDLWLNTPNAEFHLGIRGTNDSFKVLSNFQSANNDIKRIIIANGGSLEVSTVTWAVGGSDSAETLTGRANDTDLIFGYNGNDTIFGAASGLSESTGNVIIGGKGNDAIYTSIGDDQFAFDRGDGVDVISDTGGEDTLVLGSNVRAEDVLFEVDQTTGHLYIGLRDLANPSLKASQVADRIQIINGGRQLEYVDTGKLTINTIEYVQVGNTSINLLTADIPWKVVQTSGPNPYLPIVFDLQGDGLDLSEAEASDIITRTDSGALIRIGWVGPTDGILALDRNGDGQINRLSEISFVKDLPGAQTDLEGLAAYDDNKDGIFDGKDKRFGDFKIWVDANQNGRSTTKELRTLAEAGIQAIDLKGALTGLSSTNTIESHPIARINFTRTDGSSGTAYDVALARRFINQIGPDDGNAPERFRNAGAEDAMLGRLENDPRLSVLSQVGHQTLAGDAQNGPDALRAALARGDRLDYESVVGRAILDFTDHDRISGKDATRWADQLAGRRKATLAEGNGTGLSQRQVDRVRGISADGTVTARSPNGPMGAPIISEESERSRDNGSGSTVAANPRGRMAADANGDDAGSTSLLDASSQPPGSAAARADEAQPGGSQAYYAMPWYLLEDDGTLSSRRMVNARHSSIGAPEAAPMRAAQNPALPTAAAALPSGFDADRQRLTQALAAFRGASGMAAVRGPDAQALNSDALAAAALLDRLPTARHLAA